MKVTAGEFQERFAPLSERATEAPLTITKDGKDHLVLMSAAEFARLNRRDRKVMATEEVPQKIADLIAETEMDPRYDYLNEELSDWKP